MQPHASTKAARQSDSVVAFVYVYAVLWAALAVYLGAYAREGDPIAIQVTTGILLSAIVLHLIASTSAPGVSSFSSLFAVAVLTVPTAALLLHRTAVPQYYFAYLALHATIAAYIVDVYATDSSSVPRWLAAAQVAYIVILGLDTVGRLVPRLYPAADVRLFSALHQLSDIRLLLLLPIAIAWLVIAVVRCRRDGSFEEVPVVWRTDVVLPVAIAQLPLRFSAAVLTFLMIVARRIGRDFLYSFRDHAAYLLRYVVTIVAAGAMLLGARAFAPWLVKYLRTPTPPTDLLKPTRVAFLTITPLVGFTVFLIAPFLNATIATMWRPALPAQRTRQRAYQIAAVAAVPCALIGPVLWLGTNWFDLPGFSKPGVVSVTVLVLVVAMLVLGSRLRRFAIAPVQEMMPHAPPPAGASPDWREGLPVGLVGAVIILVLLGAARLPSFFGATVSRWFESSRRAPRTQEYRPILDAEIVDQQTLDDQDIARDEWHYYWIDVPARAATLRVTATHADGIDLYTKFQSKPRSRTYGCHRDGGAEKECAEVSPQAGRWWIALRGASGSGRASLRAQLLFGIDGQAGAAGASIILDPASRGPARQLTTDASGRYAAPALPADTYAVTPSKSDCVFTPASRKVTLGPSATGIDFAASCWTTLSSGVSAAGSVGAGQWRYYGINVPSGATRLQVDLSGTADVDLYTQRDTLPTKDHSICREAGSSYSERCTQAQSPAGAWWIGVYGSAAADYTIRASYR